jgi:murein L,D-transpeptidase YcbB/YkuD
MFMRIRVPRTLTLAAAAAVSLLSASSTASAASCENIGRTLRQTGAAGTIQREPVEAFYAATGNSCAWNEESAETLTAALNAAGDHGLDPALFHSGEARLAAGADPAARDVLLTDGALKYAAALTRGLSGEAPRDKDRAHSRSQSEFVDGLLTALERGDVQGWLESLPPRTEDYRRLMSALQSYRAIEQAGGFPVMPDELAMKSKRKYRNYAELRRRLAMEGDLGADSGLNAFDEELRDGVANFQERNGLLANGRVTWKTLARLNISASERVAQIALNLERLRATLEEEEATRVEVNVPAAAATLYRDGVPQMKMNVVVGKPDNATPTLRSTIDTIILNPTWTIPESIIKKEIMPAVKRNKNYLTRNRMYWSGDQLIQEPGPHNALGRIKFDFPNRYSVYLHDTPSRRAFTDAERALSHGCVRLERPLDLAAELLRGSERWTAGALQDAIDGGKTRRIALSEPMPVVIVYQTVFVADNGAVNFRPDVYGLDTKLTLALAQRAGAMRSEPTQW